MKLGWLWLSILNTTASPSPMSMTPAFSPGPWITQGALVGRLRRCTLEDLYEQCSFHIAEKMPSSVKLGSRPIKSRMRWYSSGLRPCSAISAGVMGDSLGITDRSARGERELRCLRQMIDQSGKQPAPVGRTERCFHVVFRVRHHAEHIAALVDDAGDGVEGAVVVPV